MPEVTKVTTDREVDVCIVGLGAVGALVAYALAGRGRRVLALEAGPPGNGRRVVMDELLCSTLRNAWGDAKFNGELPTWRPNSESPQQPMRVHARMANGVGGSSVSYAGTSLRFHPDDFRVRTNTLARYGQGALPEGSDVTDWPLTYDELEPYYDEAERLLGVSGRAGNIQGTIMPGGNPFEGARSRPYPLPPLRRSGIGDLFAEASRSLGYHPFPVPTAILSEPYDGRQACTYCSYCSRMECHVGAKGSTLVAVVPKTLATGNLEVRTGCRVVSVATSDSGEVVGVEYEGPDGRVLQPAGTVVLASYAFENVRLLLLSTSRRHPRGLGNDLGQVGRGYMTHQGNLVFGLFEGRRLHRFIGPYSQGQSFDDLNADNFDHTGMGFIRGARVLIGSQQTPILDSQHRPPEVARWGAPFKRFLVNHFDSVAFVAANPEVLPYTANYLDLDPGVRDAHGLPVVRITFDVQKNERRMMQYLRREATRVMAAMGATRVWSPKTATTALSTHDAGGTRIGVDPAQSVVDSFGEVHGVPRLFVVGGSTFPTHSGVNSTLTMQALGLRTGEHIARRGM